MTKHIVEILLFIPAALYTGYLLFISEVVQKVMNRQDEATFQNFINTLSKTAQKSPYAIFVGFITLFGMIPYFIIYGFSNWFYAGGLIVFIATSIISKSQNGSIYERIALLDGTDRDQLNNERIKLQSANKLRAYVQSVSLALMAIGLLGIV